MSKFDFNRAIKNKVPLHSYGSELKLQSLIENVRKSDHYSMEELRIITIKALKLLSGKVTIADIQGVSDDPMLGEAAERSALTPPRAAINSRDQNTDKKVYLDKKIFLPKELKFILLEVLTLCLIGLLAFFIFPMLGASAANVLNLEDGIKKGVNPIIKFLLNYNAGFIFIGSAIGIISGTGDFWTRVKFWGGGAIVASAGMKAMEGILGIEMPS